MVFRVAKSKNILGVGVLLFTLWAVLGTSVPGHDGISDGNFHITSDCTTPVLEENITTTAGVVTAPGGVSYTDFGFPDATVKLGTENSGVVGAVTRKCNDSYGDEDSDSYVFSCFDDGDFSCTILIIKR
jgi:hypothetical protein